MSPADTTVDLTSGNHRPTQIDGVQILRGIAVIQIAWIHAGQHLLNPAWTVDFGIFGIDIFFVISGFIMSMIALRERHPPGRAAASRFFIRRVIRIYPIYWIFSSLLAIRLLHAHQRIQFGYVWGLLLVPPPHYLLLGVAWTLFFEMLFYSLMAFVIFFTVKHALPLLALIMIALVCVGLSFDIRQTAWIVPCNPILIEFLFGVAVAALYVRFSKSRLAGLGSIAAGSLLAIFLAIRPLPQIANSAQMILFNIGVFQRVATWGVSAALIVGGVVFFSPTITTRFGRLFVAIGTASYSAYLVSRSVLEFGARCLHRLFDTARTWQECLAFQGLLVVAVLFVGWFSYIFLELPLLTRMNRWAARTAAKSRADNMVYQPGTIRE
jgi:peptidoglycan/LPS O-acetylase OafA/YrhL